MTSVNFEKISGIKFQTCQHPDFNYQQTLEFCLKSRKKSNLVACFSRGSVETCARCYTLPVSAYSVSKMGVGATKIQSQNLIKAIGAHCQKIGAHKAAPVHRCFAISEPAGSKSEIKFFSNRT
ncbi:hypothetical protein MNBD_ALPHA02-962, partial [hydrothermal vent metagenome]